MALPRNALRSSLYDDAVEALQCELGTRLAQLNTRKDDVGRLERLTTHLVANGWAARADVATHPHSGVTLRLWVNVVGNVELTALLRDIAVQCIDVARKSSQDYDDRVAYDLVLADHMQVLMRVAVARTPAKAAA